MEIKVNYLARWCIGVALACLLCMLGVCAVPHEAQAATKEANGVYSLHAYSWQEATASDVYKNADVTGDKKNDIVQVNVENKKYTNDDGTSYYYPESYSLQVNSQTLKTWDHSKWGFSVRVITLANKKSFLEIAESSNYGLFNEVLIHKLYQVKNGKLKSVCDLRKLVSAKTLAKHDGELEVAKVKKNTICLMARLNTKALGYVRSAGSSTGTGGPSYLQLAYSGSKFKVKSSSVKAFTKSGDLTAAKKIKTAKSVGSKKAGVAIAKGKKFTVQKMVVKDKKLYVQVKAKKGGKTGWVQLGKTKLVKQRAL